MITEPDHLWDLLLESDTQAVVVIGTKGQTVVGEAEPQADGTEPSVVLGDQRVVDVVQRGDHLDPAKGCPEHPVFGQRDAIALVHSKQFE